MGAPDNPKRREEQIDHERRSANRTRDDADWESKVIGRLGGRLRNLPVDGEEKIGWELLEKPGEEGKRTPVRKRKKSG